MANNCCAVGQGASDRDHGQLIDQARDFFSLNDGALEWRPRNLGDAARLDLIDIFDSFAYLRPHSHENAEQPRARVIQADTAHEEMPAWLRSGRDEPKRRKR